jgi:hypothetical protein
VDAELDRLVAAEPTILAQLREAAGPEVPIIGMSYYHPFLPDLWFGTQDVGALHGAVDSILGFNDFLASIYEAAGDPVANVEGAFSTNDVGDADSDGVPNNVEHVCALTWRCASPTACPRRPPEHGRLRRHRAGLRAGAAVNRGVGP